MAPEDVLAVHVMFYACARENTISPEVAKNFKGRFIGEGANDRQASSYPLCCYGVLNLRRTSWPMPVG